jgi:hypothetical protein
MSRSVRFDKNTCAGHPNPRRCPSLGQQNVPLLVLHVSCASPGLTALVPNSHPACAVISYHSVSLVYSSDANCHSISDDRRAAIVAGSHRFASRDCDRIAYWNSIFPTASCEMGCRIWAGLDCAARLSKLVHLHLCGVIKQSRVHTAEVLPFIRVMTQLSPDKSPLLLLQTVDCLGIHENVAINIAACPTVSAIEFEKHT